MPVEIVDDARAVEIDRDLDVGFLGLALDEPCGLAHARPVPSDDFAAPFYARRLR